MLIGNWEKTSHQGHEAYRFNPRLIRNLMKINLNYKNNSFKNETHNCRTSVLVKNYYELRHVSLIQKAWSSKYCNSKAPSYAAIKYIVFQFEKTGSVLEKSNKQTKPEVKSEKRLIKSLNMI